MIVECNVPHRCCFSCLECPVTKGNSAWKNLLKQTLDDLIEMTRGVPRNLRNRAKRGHLKTMVR